MTYLKNILGPQKFTKPITFKSLIYLSILTALFTVNSCSDDGDNFTPSASDILATIDENPSNGTTIGTVATNLTGTLNYTITSQSVTGALSINATSGVVTVSDATLFDYETNTMLTAQVEVTNSSDTATSMIQVNLNNVDDIASFLSTSRAAYEAASDGQWVAVTSTEYNNLANSLNEISKIATSDSEYNTSSPVILGPIVTIMNNNGSEMPANSLVFAIKFWSMESSGSGIKIKQSENATTNYSDLGSTFGASNTGDNYLVLKGNSSSLPATGYIAIFDPTGDIIGANGSVSGTESFYASGDVNTLDMTAPGVIVYYQCLSTTQKQWD